MKLQPVPLKYHQISAELVSNIQSGVYQTGDKLPSENELAASFRASRSTVIRALRVVEEQGLIERRQGSGSFITEKATHQPVKRAAAIGFLSTVQSGRFPDSIVDQIRSRLALAMQRRGSTLIVHAIEPTDDPATIARSIAEQRVGGVFLVPMPPWSSPWTNEELVDRVVKRGLPIVLLDGDLAPSPHRSDFDLVGVDNRHCGYLQTEHLLKMGLRRIVYLGIKGAAPTVVDRQLGYRQAMQAYGEDPSQWICDAPTDDVEESFVAEIIRKHRPEGIVCKSDEFAALLMHHLPAMGIQVPRDLKVVGFDDRPIGSLLPVTLTTIGQPVAEIAETALNLMDLRIAHPDRAASQVQLAGKLIVRQSTAL